MKKLIAISTLFCFFLSTGMAQEVTIKKVKKRYEYSLAGESIKLRNMSDYLLDDPNIKKRITAARVSNFAANVTAFGGGWFIGGAAGKAIRDDYTDVLIDEIGIGLGLIGLAILINSNSKKEAHRAVLMHNALVTNKGEANGFSLELKPTNNGVGLFVKF